MTRKEALETLRQADHAILGPCEAQEIAAAYGLEIGLTRYTVGAGRVVSAPSYSTDGTFEGVASYVLACKIATHIGATYKAMHGIGSQLREACDAIECKEGRTEPSAA